MLIDNVNRREREELIEHFESRPSLWREVNGYTWARYQGDAVVLVLEAHPDLDLELVWCEQGWMSDGLSYIQWLLSHFTTRGYRTRLQALLPAVGPNMINTIVAMLDGWETSPEEKVMASGEEQVDDIKVVIKASSTLTSPKVVGGGRVELSPYLRKLLGYK